MWQKKISCLKQFDFDEAKQFFARHGATQQHHTRAYKFFVEGFLHDIWINESELSIKARCYHSQKRNEKPHSLYFVFKSGNEEQLCLQECHCSCEVGLSQSCHHLISLAYYLQDKLLREEDEVLDVASTSKPMEWNKPRGTKILPQSIVNAVFHKPTKINRKKRPIMSTFLTPDSLLKENELNKIKMETMKKGLRKINKKIPFSYLINDRNQDESMTTMAMQNFNTLQQNHQVEVLPISLPVLDMECINILISMPMPREDTFFNVDFEDAKNIEILTRQQSDSKEWKEYRKGRLTASNFGSLCKRNKPFEFSYFNSIWEAQDLGHVKAVQHGKNHETNARILYEQKTKNVVCLCGLIVHPYAPYLGASPDGIIKRGNEYGILEIKCPFSKKNKNLKEALKSKTFFLKEDENKRLFLKENHNYYYQVQGQMLITGIKWCDLAVYFKEENEIVIVKVEFDQNFCYKMFEKLTNIYNIYLSFYYVFY